ncbi:9772_t:CDS:2 [Paraglomus occultum]|uniref:9772_t:CDS:1 n=1 Tax=Paraglomus occultum TaxID=144539 RepID=A0A9N9DIW8_9GLOM|nr:9772_t:CDS:2 [Paraglomus occultum]
MKTDEKSTQASSSSNQSDIIEEDAIEHAETIELEMSAVPIVGLMIAFSIAGVLIRVKLTELNSYPGVPVFPLLYAQFVGCLIMGICIQSKDMLFDTYYPLYVGIATGLCGSITSFSSFELATFRAVINDGIGYGIMAGLTHVMITVGMSVVAFRFGKDLTEVVTSKRRENRKKRLYKLVPIDFRKNGLKLDFGCVAIGAIVWIAAVSLAIVWREQRPILFATVFGPVGTLSRWRLGAFNSAKTVFPLGTFAANMLGCLCLSILFLLSHGSVSSNIGCDIIAGLSDGFCGCLTTISTFAVELTTLSRGFAYRYAIVSVILGQLVMIFVLGIHYWTANLNNTCA